MLSSPLFFPVGHCFRELSKIKFKVYGVINFLNKNIIFFDILRRRKSVSFKLDRILNKEHFYEKKMEKLCTKNPFPNPFLILVINPKHPFHARNSFKNKMFWKTIIKNALKSLLYFFSIPVSFNGQDYDTHYDKNTNGGVLLLSKLQA